MKSDAQESSAGQLFRTRISGSYLNLQSLEMFRAVVTEGGVSKAAASMRRSPSNISTRIKTLERILDRRLFDRRAGRLELTADGDTLLAYADRLLTLSAGASEVLETGRASGVFRIGAMECTALARLPAMLSSYRERYPAVQITVHTDTAGKLMDRLQSYEIDIALVPEPVFFDGISTQPVCHEELVLVTPRCLPPVADPRELNGSAFVAFAECCVYRRYLQRWLLDSGIVPDRVVAVTSYLSMLAAVSAGTAYAVVPRCVLQIVRTEALRIRTYRLSGPMTRIATVLAWRSDFISTKLDALQELLPDPLR